MTAPTSIPHPEALLAERDWLRRLARSLVRDEATADDLAQETLVAALERPPARPGPLRPWLTGVARNLLAQRRRTDGRRARREEDRAADDAEVDTDVLVERVDTQRHVAAAVVELDEPYRRTLLLRYYQDLSPAAIARLDGVKPATVRWRLAEGRNRLRARLDRDHDGDRAAWMAGVGALARETPRTTAAAGSVAALLGGAFLSGTTKIVVGAAAVAGALALAVLPQFADDAPSSPSDDVGGGALAALAPVESSAPTAEAPDVVSDRLAVDVPTPADAPETGAEVPYVTGRVVDRDGRGVAGVELRFEAPYEHVVGVSDDDGHVTVELGPAAGPDDERTSVLVSTVHPAWTRARALITAPLVEPEFLGELHVEPGGTITGIVVDDEGRPVPHALVRTARTDFSADEHERFGARGYPPTVGNRRREVDAGPHGRFVLEAFPVGPTRVSAFAPGRIAALSDEIVVTAGVTTNVDLALDARSPDRIIRGRVVDELGAPMADIWLSDRPDDALDRDRRTVKLGPDGRFDLTVWSDAPWALRASSKYGTHHTATLAGVAPGTDDVVVTVERRTFLSIVPTLAGPSLDTSVYANAFPVDGDTVLSAASSKLVVPPIDGPHDELTVAPAIELAVPAEPFRIEVSAGGFGTVTLGPFDPDGVPRTLDAALTRDGVGAVRGVVVSGGVPVFGARVMLCAEPRAGDPWFQAIDRRGAGIDLFHDAKPAKRFRPTDEFGRFELTFHEPGPHRLVVAPSRPTGKAEWAATGVRLDLDELAPTGPILVELTRGGAIEGRVSVPDGRLPGEVVVVATRGDGLTISAQPDAEGRYRLDALATGRWQVAEGDPSVSGGAFGPGRAIAPLDELPWQCEVEEGRTTRYDLDLRAPRELSRLTGAVTVDGRPAVGWTVCLDFVAQRPTYGFEIATTDDQGSFELSTPDRGLHFVRVESGGLHGIAILQRVDLGPEPTTLAWNLETASLAGRIADHDRDGWRYLCTELGPDCWAQVGFRLDADGAFDLETVPAGRARILDWTEGEIFFPEGNPVLGAIDLAPGERATVELP